MNTHKIIALGREIGKGGYHKFVLTTCSYCNKKRWVGIRDTQRKTFTGMCKNCFSTKGQNGVNSPNWKGGKTIDTKGYVKILAKNHPFAGKDGYVLEHRLIMAELVGIEYVYDMVVHHKDGDRQNNKPGNLELITRSEHSSLHSRKPETITRLPGEPNPDIKCMCSCGQTFPKYDKKNRPRKYINGHHMRVKPLVRAKWC